MRPRALAWAVIGSLAFVLAGCGSGMKKTVTGPGPTAPPPVVALVAPAPRAVGVPDIDPDIWAEFTEPLDPSTVTGLDPRALDVVALPALAAS